MHFGLGGFAFGGVWGFGRLYVWVWVVLLLGALGLLGSCVFGFGVLADCSLGVVVVFILGAFVIWGSFALRARWFYCWGFGAVG